MNHTTAAIVAGLTGFAVMALELTAVRLMAPHFGDSTYVWTNVIGVIMVALALGAFLGGRMADRKLGRDRLFMLLLIAGLITSLVPLLARPIGEWLVPTDLPLDSAMGALVRGSLAATTMLFAPPVLLVACVSPMLIALLASQDGKVGRASGLISCAATVGSLIGTFAATHVLIPEFNSRNTVWICAGAMFGAALICRKNSGGAAAFAVPCLLWLVVPDQRKAAGPDEVVLAEVESKYQFLQVVELVGSNPRRTSLKINEGLDSFHSVAYAGSPYTRGSYYDYHVVAPFLAGDGKAPVDLRVLSLGEAAGTFGRLFAHVHRGCTLDAVEIDPAVLALGADYFPGDRPRGGQFAVDARVFVNNTSQRYDVVLVDAYKHQIYIPAHVASEQFFRGVHRVLLDGGVVSVNSGGTRFTDPVVRALCSTMAEVFGSAWAFRVPASRNFVLLARKGKPLNHECLAAAPGIDDDLQRILQQMSPRAAWREYGVADVVLQDDRPFLDVLQQDVYSRISGEAKLIPIGGSRPVAEVQQLVLSLRKKDEIEGALAAIRTAAQPTAWLRFVAGDCRWMLRDAAGAVLEYEAARRLGMQSRQLEDNLAGAGAEAAGRRSAWRVGGRNGWIALVAIVGLLGLAFAFRRFLE